MRLERIQIAGWGLASMFAQTAHVLAIDPRGKICNVTGKDAEAIGSCKTSEVQKRLFPNARSLLSYGSQWRVCRGKGL